jgi:hypothetical protein
VHFRSPSQPPPIIHEVLNHPWMLCGFPGPPESHLICREPLCTDKLDKQVLHGVKGFEFGSEEEIEHKLIQVLESDEYIRTVQAWERKRNGGSNGHGHLRWGAGESVSNLSLAISFNGSHKGDGSPLSTPTPTKSRWFFGFDFY